MTAQPAAEYSQAFLEAYGRALSREEIRLVQAHRGLDAEMQKALLNLAGALVVERVQRGAR